MKKKYEKIFRQDYLDWYRENEGARRMVAADPDRMTYHIQPETGWVNDPNGLCQVNGTYHIFYQYDPFDADGIFKLWGHTSTRDFVHYQDWEPALYPDTDWDAHGVYSGSAFVKNKTIHFFYTGNVKLFDRDDYDYINSGRGSNVVHCTSTDGIHISEKHLVLANIDYPEDISCHVRDPKIIERDGAYYMVLGARDRESAGLVLVYRSTDLDNWTYHGRITTKNTFGYMWECPDLFELDGKLVLICCPQGVAKDGVNFANVHQCTAVVIDYDFREGDWEMEDASGFYQVDRGCDFYAPQTFLDENGRRILIGWMGIPDADYTNPTTEQGWQHALTLPRQLHLVGDRITQTPIPELHALRKNERVYETIKAANAAGQECFASEIQIAFSRCERAVVTLKEGVTLTWDGKMLTLDLGSYGSGRDSRAVCLESLRNVNIFLDHSALEIFVNDGEEIFTSRMYSRNGAFSIAGDGEAKVTIWDLDPIEISKSEQ